jgi:predicted lipid-binding transport protein (Tim44 family)
MNGFADIYTIIFMVIAVVVVLRLRSVLGKRTGHERPPFDPYSRREPLPGAPAEGNVIGLPPRPGVRNGPQTADIAAAAEERIKTIAPDGSPLNAGLKAVATSDPTFDPKEFLTGARGAYEMIVTAFAEGDRKTLRQLLSREVFDGFVQAISQREGRNETIDFKFVGIDKADITAAGVKGTSAQITVRFLSKLVSATRDGAGKVVDGDPMHVGDVTDIWTFSRETTSRDPNWKLVATESVE